METDMTNAFFCSDLQLLQDASADPFACNGSGQLPDIPRLQELALRSSERRDSVPRSPRPRTDAAPPDAARHGAGGEEEVPRCLGVKGTQGQCLVESGNAGAEVAEVLGEAPK